MKHILFLLFLFAFFVAEAQPQRGLKRDLDASEFPTISFVWNEVGEELDKSKFCLTEDGQNIDFQFKMLENNYEGMHKSVLFLWEDIASHNKANNNQSQITKMLLEDFFNGANIKNDKFNVAAFNRKKNGEPVLKLLNKEFTSDKNKLLSVIKNHSFSKEKFSSYGEDTDLYSAISEGIRLLKKEDTDYKVVVVVTAGKNINVSGASVEMETIRREAEEAGIQVYAVRFPVYGPTPVLDVLIEGSLGYTITYNTFEQTANDLKTLYDNLDERCYGHDYEFSFETSAKKDGNTHSISFFVNKISKGPLNFNAPGSPVASGKTFVIWIKDNLILFILIVVGFVAIVIVVALLIRRKIQKHNREIAENEMMLEGKISDSNKIIEEMKNKAARDEMDRKASEERKRKEEAVAKLANIMQVKNLYPRLQCNVEGNMFSYSISKPSTKIGRNSDNDIVLPHKTVSGYHAEILFDGASFVLNNRSQTYTQGVVVNGQFFQQCTLKNGDVIGFGVATVSFYL